MKKNLKKITIVSKQKKSTSLVDFFRKYAYFYKSCTKYKNMFTPT